MNSIIFQSVTRLLTPILYVMALHLFLRGHNFAGGGFIAGLVAASAVIIRGLAFGVHKIPSKFLNDTLPMAGIGLLIAAFSAILPLFFGKPFMAGLWGYLPLGFFKWKVGTPVLFDLGVFIVVMSVVSACVFSLLKKEEVKK